ncbi:MAG: sigma-70 family RNA polymerase sigma factor [bacterium]|nr:sigma-70 family RNA polymerase sigma factor [bacterium]
MTAIPTEHLSLIKRVAYRLIRRLPPSVEVDDLIAYGVVGYLQSAPRWDASRGPFETFIEFRVRGAMFDSLRDLDMVPRSVRDRAKALLRAEPVLSARLGRAPSHEELGKELDASIEQVEEALQSSFVVSLDDTNDSRSRSLLERLTDESTGAEETDSLIDALRLAGKLDRALSALNSREESLIRAYFYEEKSELEIAHALGITESRVSQLLTMILKKLKDILDDLARADALLHSIRSAPAASRDADEETSEDLDVALGALIAELT